MRELKVYNTLTRKKETFVPVTPGQVKMYVCGITPYNHSHMGNARPFVTWDVIKRYLEHLAMKSRTSRTSPTSMIRSSTPPTAKASRGIPFPTAISHRTSTSWTSSTSAGPTSIPAYRNTWMKSSTWSRPHRQRLCYVIDHDVYYSVEKFADYGELSGRSLDDMMAGARIEVDDRKHNPMDFALWKGAKPGEPSWDSPWGKGRPGWHIECSAMSNKYLATPSTSTAAAATSSSRTMKTKSPSPKPLRARNRWSNTGSTTASSPSTRKR